MKSMAVNETVEKILYKQAERQDGDFLYSHFASGLDERKEARFDKNYLSEDDIDKIWAIQAV
jgi:hypothetical protein